MYVKFAFYTPIAENVLVTDENIRFVNIEYWLKLVFMKKILSEHFQRCVKNRPSKKVEV